MKKTLFLLLILILVGCKANNPEVKKSETNLEKTTIKNDKKIEFSIVNSAEYSIADDLKSLEKNSDAIVFAKVNSKLGSEIEGLGIRPTTEYKLDIIEVIKGKDINKNINIRMTGGIVTLKEFKEFNFPESNEKLGIDKFTDKELEEKFISIFPQEYTELEKDKSYMIFLYKKENLKSGKEEYYVLTDGLSIYEPKDTSTKNSSASKEMYNKHNEKTLDLDEVRKVVKN